MDLVILMNYLNVADTWFLSGMLWITKAAKVINNSCLEKVNESKTVYTPIRKRQLFGHIIGREAFDNTMMNIHVSARNGRQKGSILGGLRLSHVEISVELIQNISAEICGKL